MSNQLFSVKLAIFTSAITYDSFCTNVHCHVRKYSLSSADTLGHFVLHIPSTFKILLFTFCLFMMRYFVYIVLWAFLLWCQWNPINYNIQMISLIFHLFLKEILCLYCVVNLVVMMSVKSDLLEHPNECYICINLLVFIVQ